MGDYYDNSEDKKHSADDEYVNAVDEDESVFKESDFANFCILTEQQKLFLESLHNNYEIEGSSFSIGDKPMDDYDILNNDHVRISEINDDLMGHSVDYIS